MQANILEVLDVFGALGIEVTEGQLRIENGFSNAGSRLFWTKPGENLRAPKESVTSEVLNILSVVLGYKLKQMCFALKMAPALLAVDCIWVY